MLVKWQYLDTLNVVHFFKGVFHFLWGDYTRAKQVASYGEQRDSRARKTSMSPSQLAFKQEAW